MPKRRRSLRRKLTLWMVIVWGVVHGTLALVILLYERNAVDHFFNARLSARSIDIAAAVEPFLPEIKDDDLARIASNHSRFVMGEGFELVVYAPDGTPLAASRRPAPDLSQIAEDGGPEVGAGLAFQSRVLKVSEGEGTAPRVRAIVMNVPSDRAAGYRLLVGTGDTYARRMIRRLREVLVASVLAGLVGAAVAGWLISGLATEPLRRLLESMQRMNPGTVGTAVDMQGGSEELAIVRRELDAMRSRMQAGFRAQERFISNVSHELKTPISVLMTEMQTLPRLEKAPDELREFIQSVREELGRLGGMVDSFLLLTRVRDGKPLTAAAGSYLVNELIMDSVESCAQMAGMHSVVLSPSLLADEADLDLQIRGVPDLLRTMLDNLVRNAIRFSPANGRVEVGALRQGGKVRIVVRDHGPGIPPEMIDKVFDRFAQASSEERRGRGHGLGLEIAQGIAELHGGSIKAENCEDRGCRFTVTLPVGNAWAESGVGGVLPDEEVEEHPDQREQDDQ